MARRRGTAATGRRRIAAEGFRSVAGRETVGPGWVFVVSSPSGGGKTTVVRRLMRRRPSMTRSVSVTTRAPRLGERDGREYRFLSMTEFQRLRRSQGLLEWAKVHGACYGTPKAPISRAINRGRDVILSIDVRGARAIRRLLGPRAVLVFLLPRSLTELQRRLRDRRTDSPAAIRQRMRAAKQELACTRWYDYAVVNDHLNDAVQQLDAIVMAQRCRVTRSFRSRRPSPGTRRRRVGDVSAGGRQTDGPSRQAPPRDGRVVAEGRAP